MRHLLLKPFAGLIFLLGVAPAIFAQTNALVINSTTLDEKGKAITSKIYLKDDKMLSETSTDKGESVVLFDAATETMYVINHKQKEYTEMSREDLQAMSAMLSEQLAVMEQQLEMMPESQREMLREKMGAAFGSAQKPAEYSLETSGVEVNGWETDKYVGMAEGKKQSEIYVASFQELGQEQEDFKAIEAFFDMMKEHMQGMSKMMSAAGIGFFSDSMPGYEKGLPVKSTLYNSKGEAISNTSMDSISEENVAATTFSVPENYKKKKMMK